MASLRKAAQDRVIAVSSAQFRVLEGSTSPEWFRTVVKIMLSCPLEGTWHLLCLLRLRIIQDDAPQNCEPDDLSIIVLYVANQSAFHDECVHELFWVVANMFKLFAGLALEKIDVQKLFEQHAAQFAKFTLRTQFAIITAMFNYTTALPECKSLSDNFMDTLLVLLPSTSDESCLYRLFGAIGNAAEFSPVAKRRLAARKHLIQDNPTFTGARTPSLVFDILHMLE
jgi:hypothetical protein